MKKALALLLVLTMTMSVCALGLAEATTGDTPFVVAYSPFSEKFSPYVADTAYDQDVVGMTQLALMTTDRMGGIIYNGIEGETISYNGTDYTYYGPADLSVKYDEAADVTTYTAKLREDLVFSDGVPVTADDIIFNYYVFLDPAYVGSTSLSSYKIIGAQDYRTQTTSDVYDKYLAIAQAVFQAGREYVPSDAYTEEQFNGFWSCEKEAWMDIVKGIVDYVAAKYGSSTEDMLECGVPDGVLTDEYKVAAGMVTWGFGEYDPATGILTTSDGKTFNYANGEFPTLDDYYAATYAAYDGDTLKFGDTENANEEDITQMMNDKFILEYGSQDESMSGGVKNVAGIRKLDDYTVEVRTEGYEAPAVYSILGISIAPMHYYGDPAQYDYDNNMFGHPFGDVSLIESKTTKPLGAGPYMFDKYENRVVYFTANPSYYKGAPKTKHVQFKETNSSEVVDAIVSGVADAGDMNGTKTNFETVAKNNANGEICGDKLFTAQVDNLGYGYIGLNADTMCVAGDPASEASKDLRKAIATVLAVYRDVAIDSYYGSAATPIQYPISNTSWAAPQATDSDYRPAFSLDVDGNQIYSSDMSMEEKYAAALNASIGYLKAAGFTFDDATGKFVAAPEGASLSYELIIPGDGIGDHPSFGIVTDAKNALATIGIELIINDPANSTDMWDLLDTGKQNMWCAAWSSTIDPDMYQVYYSGNAIGKGGTDSNHYHIADSELDTLILDARKSDDQAYRKAIYKQCLDIIVDWAVEVPAYQRKNATLFSAERINMDTLTPDITTFYGWMTEVENLEMK